LPEGSANREEGGSGVNQKKRKSLFYTGRGLNNPGEGGQEIKRGAKKKEV